MDLFVYSDESGVFDYVHNDYYVYGGLILLGKEEKDCCERKYRKAEQSIAHHYPKGAELKASLIDNGHKAKLFRAVNQYYKFAIVINQSQVIKETFNNKKSKQRYLDFAYISGIKEVLNSMIKDNIFAIESIANMHFYVDEHSTATDGCYELREGLLQVFREGLFNFKSQTYCKPLFPDMNSLDLQFCNSAKKTLIRTSDIIANRVFHEVSSGGSAEIRDNIYVKYLP